MYFTETVAALKEQNIAGFQKRLGINGVQKFASKKAFVDYLTALDMRTVLSVPNRTRCFFHDDRHASANIYVYGQRYLYKCFAEGCTCDGKAMDLIGFYKKLRDCNYTQAIRELAVFFAAEFPNEQAENSTKIQNILLKNREIVSLIPTNVPSAFQILGTDLNVLNALYTIAEEKSKLLTCTRSGILLSESNRYVTGYMGYQKKVSRSLAVLAYFGLISRPSYDELPAKQLENALAYCKQRYAEALASGWDNQAETVNNMTRAVSQTYLRPLRKTTYSTLEKKAKRWRKMGYTKRNFTHCVIEEREGPYIAFDCYPQA